MSVIAATFSNGTPAVSLFDGVVIGAALAKLAVGIFMTPRRVFAISRKSLPSLLYTIMSIGRLPAPSSAIVVPRYLLPEFGLSSATGNFTSGVQVYAPTM